MLRKLNKIKKQAFTIIELMVSASIIAILALMVVVNFRGSNQKGILENESERLSSVIRQTQIDALIGQTVNGQLRPYAFGLHLQKCTVGAAPIFCSYLIFADENGDYKYNGGDYLMQTLNTFDKNIEFTNISTASDNDMSQIDIVSVPPNGKLYFFGTGATALTDTVVEITLRYYGSDYSKKLIVNSLSNQVDLQ